MRQLCLEQTSINRTSVNKQEEKRKKDTKKHIKIQQKQPDLFGDNYENRKKRKKFQKTCHVLPDFQDI